MTTQPTTPINDQQDLTPDSLVSRVSALVPMLREQQVESEERGTYSAEVHDALLSAGVYHLLQPSRYGGLQFDVEAFVRVVAEIAKGDPSVAWSVALGSGRALAVASMWPEAAQQTLFENEHGYFHAPHSVSGLQTFSVERTEHGYRASGKLPYCSGVPYSTHLLASAIVAGEDGGPPLPVVVVLEREQYQILDDWGGDRVLGHRASGSNSVTVSDVVIPAEMVVPFDWVSDDRVAADVGEGLHGDPMYLGRVIGMSTGEMAAVAVGAARAALEEYERLARTKRSTGLFAAKPIPGDPESALRYRDPNTHRDFGAAVALVDASEAILVSAARVFGNLTDRWSTDGRRFTWPDDLRLSLLFTQSANLAMSAVETLFQTIGSGAIRRDERLQRYFRDVSTMRTHPTLWNASAATRFGSEHLVSGSGPSLVDLPMR